MTKLSTIDLGFFLCDAGAMFGLLPKTIWSKHYYADNKNLCKLSMRAAMYQEGEKIIILDAGISFKKKLIPGGYHFFETVSLPQELEKRGISCEQVTDVVLSHLHFDHCSGILDSADGVLFSPFSQATFHVSKAQWEHHLQAPEIEQSGFIKEVTTFLQEQAKVNWIESNQWISDGLELMCYDGHTKGQLVSCIHQAEATTFFVGDVLPLSLSCRLEAISGFDIEPIISYRTRKELLEKICQYPNNEVIFYHDAYTPVAHIIRRGKGYQAVARVNKS